MIAHVTLAGFGRDLATNCHLLVAQQCPIVIIKVTHLLQWIQALLRELLSTLILRCLGCLVFTGPLLSLLEDIGVLSTHGGGLLLYGGRKG